MVGPIIIAVSAAVLFIGIIVVLWEWTVSSNPDAPHGGPIVGLAIVGLLCGGVVGCAETMKEVQAMKRGAS